MKVNIIRILKFVKFIDEPMNINYMNKADLKHCSYIEDK